MVYIGTLPSVIWKVQGLTGAERPGTPTKTTLLDPKGSSAVNTEFRDVYGGLYHGIAWDW